MAEITQTELWNGEAGARWTAFQERIDRLFAPFDEVLLRRAAPTVGESVLEVGCGCGGSTLALARAVGEGGSVLGIDLSRPMLQRARERTAGMANVTLRQGDAGRYVFPDPVTLIYSRFGVMFFDDPALSFRNLRSALGLGGRLCFVCWQALELNPWHALPLRAAARLVALPPPAEPGQPGPFSLAKEEHLQSLLTEAGFEDVQMHGHTLQLSLGDLASATELMTEVVGPLSRALATLDAFAREAARAEVRAALREHLAGDQVSLAASVWIVHAR
ncbi:MAG TPA: class I SAM-dependent methyltransferase [Polyangiales bacterium]